MNDSKDHKTAAEPPLDCNVGLREAVNELMRHQFTHSAEAMSALQRLVDAAEAGACEIDRLRDELQLASDTARYACDGWNDALMHEGAHMAAKAIEAKMVPND